MDKSNLVFLDTETTGTGSEGRLCQVAYSSNGIEVEAYFKPPVPIEIEAMSVSHITNKMVQDKEPFLESKMRNDLIDIFSKGNILVAHNAKFDVDMLQKENMRIGSSIDTLKIAQHMDKDGTILKYNLQYLRYYFDLDVKDVVAHSALGDVRVLKKLFEYFFDRMLSDMKDEQLVLQEMLEISSRPILIKKFTFGKYFGMNVADIAQNDPGYLKWLLDQKIKDKEKGNNDENWIYTLENYLVIE